MTESMKKLCILPTTKNAYKKLSKIYSNDFSCTFIFLSPFLLDRDSCDFYAYSWLAKRIWSTIKPVRLLFLYTSLFVLKKHIRNYLNANSFDFVVVSNDCGLIQGLFVEQCNKLNIPSVTHQVASGTVPSEVSVFKKFLRLVKLYVFSFPPNDGYSKQSTHVILIAEGWASDLNITKYSVFTTDTLAPPLREPITLRDLYRHPKIVFIGQPLFEIGLMEKAQIENYYLKLKILFELLAKQGVKLDYKPHPQEEYYKKVTWLNVIAQTPELTLSEYDVFISLMSTMNLDAKLLGKISLRFSPTKVDPKYLRQSANYFHSDILLDDEQIEVMEIDRAKRSYTTSSCSSILEIYENFKP